MAKRDPLKQLIRKFPAPKELEGIMKSLSQETDRSAAIIAAGVIEGLLEKIIIHKLTNKDSNLVGQLFNNRGPMSDFHSKILIASAFGIISKNAEQDLTKIKTIRNVFAHAIHAISFDIPEIDNEIRGFICIGAMYKSAEDSGSPMDRLGNKAAYILNCHLLSIVFDGNHQQEGGNPIIREYSDCIEIARARGLYP